MKLRDFSLILLTVGIGVLALVGGGYYFTRSSRPIPTPVSINSGITGKATLGPTCPVEKPGEVCSQPYRGMIVVKSSDGSGEITKFTTDAKGEFKVNLAPGSYVLENEGQTRFPFLKEVRVEVKRDEFTEVQLNFDTGIR
ncbi:MAG: hypothetical protein Q8P89_03475 [bacterium]|nr:hypothetical protein [bacterium]